MEAGFIDSFCPNIRVFSLRAAALFLIFTVGFMTSSGCRKPIDALEATSVRNVKHQVSPGPSVTVPSAAEMAGQLPFSNPSVSVSLFISQLQKEVASAHAFPAMQREFKLFAKKHNLDLNNQDLFSEFVTIKVLFEATRDGGLWWLRWDITNQEPNSSHIWKQWRSASPNQTIRQGSAVAECDEISALFSFLAHRLGVQKAGLFWPVWNHTVAVWTVKDIQMHDVRITVPTTHIFLDFEDRFDHIDNPEFDPYKQKTITTYAFRDIDDSFLIPADLANFFIAQIRIYSGASEQILHDLSFQRRSLMQNPRAVHSIQKAIRKQRDSLIASSGPQADVIALSAFLESIAEPPE